MTWDAAEFERNRQAVQRATAMTEDELINRLARPIYVLRMANALNPGRDPESPRARGAARRAEQARADIRAACIEYVESLPATTVVIPIDPRVLGSI